MLNPLQANGLTQSINPAGFERPRAENAPGAPERPRDRVEFGRGGRPDAAQAQSIVLERAYARLRGVLEQARAELGIPEGAVLDTSPEATANRIADFALNFFDRYAENNGLADDEAGRAQFAGFIGGAIAQGIEEARGILSALQVLDGTIASNVDTTQSIIQQRLDDFVKNGRSGPAV